jgi:hypothetical protein
MRHIEWTTKFAQSELDCAKQKAGKFYLVAHIPEYRLEDNLGGIK